MVKIAILYFSTGRYEYLFPVLDSMEKFIDWGENTEIIRIFIDDYPRDRDDSLLDYIKDRYSMDVMIRNDVNMGQSAAWRKIWELVPSDVDYIWQQEDDMEILEPVNVDDMINVLEHGISDIPSGSETPVCPHAFYQIIMKRNICYSHGDFVKEIEDGKEGVEMDIDGVPIVKFNSGWFIPHPGIYPAWIARLQYVKNPQEGVVRHVIRQKYPYLRAALYGKRADKHRVMHLGEFTRGKKMLPGEPGYESQVKPYKDDRDYYSLKYLTEWKGSRNYELAQLHIQLKTPDWEDRVRNYYKKCIDVDVDIDKKYKAAQYLLKNHTYTESERVELHTRIIQFKPHALDSWFDIMMYWNKINKQLSYQIGIQGYEAAKKHGLDKIPVNDVARHAFELCMIAYYSNNNEKLSELVKLVPKNHPLNGQHANNMKFYDSRIESIAPRTALSRYKAPSVLIVDNFLDNPMAEREFALKQDFNVDGNYPGHRTKSFATDDDKRMFEELLGKKITYWPDTYNGSYQYVTKSMKSWIHRDQTTHSAMIFLTPDPAPNSGTIIYEHKTGGTLESDNTDGKFDKDSYNPDAWNIMDVAGNRFNRLSIFQGIASHISADYFGDCLENGRLFKIFFFNVADSLKD